MTHETIYNMTALTVSRAERGDTGSYTVAIENPHGKVSATVKVQVIGEWQSDLLPGTLLLLCREVAFLFVCHRECVNINLAMCSQCIFNS